MTYLPYQALIEATFDVVDRSGDEFLCRCKWHDDKGRPNLYVNARKGLYYCHACNAKGSLDKTDLPVPDTKDLRERLGEMTVDEPQEYAPRWYPEAWLRQFDLPNTYWEDRGLSDRTVERFRLGYDPMHNAATIPIRDEKNHVLGVIRRHLDPDTCGVCQQNENMKWIPRYLYPKGVPKARYLFGAWLIRQRHTKVAIVEGPVDVLACWDARVPALGMFGSAMSEDQHHLLHRLGIEQIVVMTDNDHAGRKAAVDIIEIVDDMKVMVGKWRHYWAAKDPAELSPQQRRKMYHSAKPWHEWLHDVVQ